MDQNVSLLQITTRIKQFDNIYNTELTKEKKAKKFKKKSIYKK